MIDLTFLNNLPKEFAKESNLLKYLLNIFNEIKAQASYIKSTIVIEHKTFETLSKNLLSHFKQYTTETANLEDFTHLLQFQNTFIGLFDSLYSEINYSVVSIVNNAYDEITEDTNELSKGLVENLTFAFKDLSNARMKYKLAITKTEKIFKELEGNITNKRKIESDEKQSYNLTIKEKNDEKILNNFYEYEESKTNMIQLYEECQKIEVLTNELIKNTLINSTKFIFEGIKILRSSFTTLIKEKHNTGNKSMLECIKVWERLNTVTMNFDNLEKKFNDSKGIKYEISNDFIIDLKVDEQFNKNNFQTSTLTDDLLSFVSTFLQNISLRKKILSNLLKCTQEILRQYEGSISLSSKLIKNLSQPKLSVTQQCPFIIQIGEFLRSLFELVIKKYEDFNKNIFNITNFVEHQVLKDINSDEVILTQTLSRLQKESANFKSNLSKLNTNKDKLTQSIEKMKETIQNEPNSFSRYEKQFLSLRAEEGYINDNLNDTYKKYKKILEECSDIIKKTVTSYREKEISKTNELRELLTIPVQAKEKIFAQIIEFLDYSNQIPMESEISFVCIKNVFLTMVKENEIPQQNSNLDIHGVIYNFITEVSNMKGIKNEIQSKELDLINFINIEEVVSLKEFELGNFLTADEINSYLEKIKFLKTNSMKISIRNLQNKRKHDGIFNIDDDETVVADYSCALSETILLQGKLFVTNKKLVFYSWFNNSTLFGKTLIEIPKEDILEVEKKCNKIFDNMITIRTKTTQFLLASMINRDKCYNVIKEQMFGEVASVDIGASERDERQKISSSAVSEHSGKAELDKSQGFPETELLVLSERDKTLLQEESLDKENEIQFKQDESTIQENTHNHLGNDSNNIETNELVTIKSVQSVNLESESIRFDFEALNSLSKIRLNTYMLNQKTNFTSTFVNKHSMGDIPLSLIFEQIFNPDQVCDELGKNMSFVNSYLDMRKDYNVVLTKVKGFDDIPSYYKDPRNFYSGHDLILYLEKEIRDNSPAYEAMEYKYNYTHPILKKKFMGPSKLEVEDVFKFHFISPKCFIVDIYSYMSGFMLIDTFYSVLQYTFDTEIQINEGAPLYNTSLTVKFGVEIVKDSWFKNKILAEATNDVEDFFQSLVMPNLVKVIESQKNAYHNEIHKMPTQHNEACTKGEDAEQEIRVVSNNVDSNILPNEDNMTSVRELESEKEKTCKLSIDRRNTFSITRSKSSLRLNSIKFESVINIFNERLNYIVLPLSILVISLLMTILPTNMLVFAFINIIGFLLVLLKLQQIGIKLNAIERQN